jgi:hypothetical protein
MTLVSTSQRVTNTAPSSAEQGMSRRWSEPAKRRVMWGTSSPTKLKSPAKLTAAPASSAEARMERNLVRPTFRPQARRALLAQTQDVHVRRQNKSKSQPRGDERQGGEQPFHGGAGKAARHEGV